jgi:hypothetical protein
MKSWRTKIPLPSNYQCMPSAIKMEEICFNPYAWSSCTMQIQLWWNYFESSQILVRGHITRPIPTHGAQTSLLHEALYRGPTHSSMPGVGDSGKLHHLAQQCHSMCPSADFSPSGLHPECCWRHSFAPHTGCVEGTLTDAVLVQHCTKLIAHKLPQLNCTCILATGQQVAQSLGKLVMEQ